MEKIPMTREGFVALESELKHLKSKERPEIIKASRKRRIATGSGTTVQDVNRVMKQFQEMSRMIKRVNKMGQKGMMRGGMMPPGLMPPR